MMDTKNINKAKKDHHLKSDAPLIKISNLKKAFGDNQVLRGFNLELYPRENVVILGKSGSGKSVLIKCLVHLVDIDEGDVFVLGRSIPDLAQDELDEIRTEVGFLFQGSALYDSMTVRENLSFPLRRHKERMRGQDENKLIIEALRSVGLEHAIDLMPAELSGGMKRRIALARTLILQPRIILYDEPTSGLDPITANEIIQLMLKIQRELDTSSLIITHDMDCARVISNRMIILQDGINYAEGTYTELSKSTDPKVKAFFKEVQNR
jgi:phospholipid/cholesterol/gamma-HCH transport system ATP-binding protein